MTIAMPTGKLYKKSVEILKAAGLYAEGLNEPARRLIFEGTARFILVKPADVPVYVEMGAADIGIVGSDVIAESARQVCELFDLGFGKCRLVMAAAAPAQELMEYNNRRVATKYPNMAREFFYEQCMEMEYVKLNGSIELAPLIGLTQQQTSANMNYREKVYNHPWAMEREAQVWRASARGGERR